MAPIASQSAAPMADDTVSEPSASPRTRRDALRPSKGPSSAGAVHGRPEAADEDGLRGAFLAYGGELLGFARRSVRDQGRAEDVVQETFMRAWRSRHRFDPSLGSLRAWLFAIERRVLIDHAAKSAPMPDDRLQAIATPFEEDWVDEALLGWQVSEAVERLDDAHRMVVVELYVNGRTSREVSELFAIPEGTVRSRAYYALRSLRVILEDVGWDR
jgi:RNA polymerase sigma-70 factor (ECF subfamily)